MAAPTFIADVADARVVVLEGLTLLFHPASGMTHILAPPSPEILAALATPGDVQVVRERLSDAFDLSGDDAPARIAARLTELEAAGLVRRA